MEYRVQRTYYGVHSTHLVENQICFKYLPGILVNLSHDPTHDPLVPHCQATLAARGSSTTSSTTWGQFMEGEGGGAV